jgi:hypothetical protein
VPLTSASIPAFVGDHAQEPRSQPAPVLDSPELAPRREGRLLNGVFSRLRVVEHCQGQAVTRFDQRTQDLSKGSVADRRGAFERCDVDHLLHALPIPVAGSGVYYSV